MSRLPVFVEFYADWCPLCHSIEPILQKLCEDFAGKVKFVRVNTDKNNELETVYNIKRRPTVLVIQEGLVRERIAGANTEAVYRESLVRAYER